MNNNFNEQNNYDYSEYEVNNNNDIPAEPENKKNLGLISMILGIIGAVIGGCGVSLPLGIVAIILALKDKAANGGKLKGFAIPGLITGIVSIVYGVIFLCLILFYIIYYVIIIGVFMAL